MKNKKTREVQTKQVRNSPRPAPTKRPLASIVEDNYIVEDESPKYSRKAYGKNRLSFYVAGRGGVVLYPGETVYGIEILPCKRPILSVAFGERFARYFRGEIELNYMAADTTAKVD